MNPVRIDPAGWTVLLDVRSPGGYLALHPTRALSRELGTPIDWLPIQVPPLQPPSEPGPDDDRGTRHRRYRAEALAREIAVYAEAQGLVMRDPYRAPDPTAVHLGWLWLRERSPDALFGFLARAFRAYWALELDSADPAAVAPLLGEHADGYREWCEDDGPATARLLAETLKERGLFGSPTHLVAEEVFLGRQHLPMIRWILEGRSGRGPI